MIEEVITIYLAWFILLYIIPIVLFFRLTIFIPELIELKGLITSPQLNDEKNTISVKHNFEEYSAKIPNKDKYSVRFNIWFRLLAEVCSDAQSGKRREPNIYLLKMKKNFNRFIEFVFLGSFVPFIINQFVYGDIENILKIHSVCMFLIFVLYRIINSKINYFQEVFYKYWYDKILNFDLFTIKEIIPFIYSSCENTSLLESINKLADADNSFAETLMTMSKTMSEKLEEFIRMQKPQEGVTYQNVTESLDKLIKKVTSLGSVYEEICYKIKDSHEHLLQITNNFLPEINALNASTKELSEIKKLFSVYKSEALEEEIIHMDKTTSFLSDTITSAFKSIENSINKYSENIAESFEKFYEISNKFTDLLSKNPEGEILENLNNLSTAFAEKGKIFDDKINLLEGAVKETCSATQKICEVLFNFSKYTNSKSFMDKISNNKGFEKDLIAASKNLISYEKLVDLYEKQIEQPNSIKLQQLNKVVFKLASDFEKLIEEG